ncbi:N-acetylneuraminate synthase family protein [Arsukibacterium indicum]|uniref:N-acetylneuraminate synthase family protein n=1 Tax=Arsukibacterium indicum TaxID=2848612 RepID=A0ABS6MI30_9GAMM|nr:N-acetylneuraminate synthase family protein [Arsukibacterium indicum]MBV2127877.1 N-acetylneuraminate synthase family protein [Arsukibacterium indicum]
MIIERNIARYIVFTDDELSHALQKISSNKSGIVFVLAQNGVLEGILTDGDLRRWLLQTNKLDLTQPVADAFNSSFVYALDDSAPAEIEQLFSSRIEYVPLLDKQSRLVGIASRKTHHIQIADFIISDDSNVFVIAEIGNNHNGDITLAKRLVDEAVAAGADCAKFQLRHMDSMYRKSGSGAQGEDLGAEYTLDLLARFQLSTAQMYEVFDYCKQRNIIPLCTPWDANSLEALEKYGMPAYKVASADLTNHELLEKLAKTRKPLLCSTGMSTEAEIKEAVTLLKRFGSQFVLLHCNSTYPAPFKDVNLRYLNRLRELAHNGLVGYSGHERGIAVAVSAVSLGAKVIEKHFTLDRNMEGNDHRVSLLPDEFKLMTQSIREIEQALGSSDTRKVTQGEMMNREVLAKSLVCTRALKPGDVISASDIDTRSPGKGLAPYMKSQLVGKTVQRDVEPGDFFYPSDLNDVQIQARHYSFNRPFGVPVRYHDFATMVGKSNFDLVEFHFSYKDLELAPAAFLNADGYDMNFVVHSPELFAGDHIMDLCAEDPVYRQRSIEELQRVINTTLKLQQYFHRAKRPLIIINAGGFTLDGFMPTQHRQEKYQLIADALRQLDTEGVEIIPQTMPPYPWHFGGQRFHNLFMDAADIVQFCQQHQMRICLDISHSKLACNLSKASFSQFIQQVAPFTAHIHIVDAENVDGEGLQIGEGEIDFAELAKQLKQLSPAASFIPEIWQGHKNEGEGFWQALELLEKYQF